MACQPTPWRHQASLTSSATPMRRRSASLAPLATAETRSTSASISAVIAPTVRLQREQFASRMGKKTAPVAGRTSTSSRRILSWASASAATTRRCSTKPSIAAWIRRTPSWAGPGSRSIGAARKRTLAALYRPRRRRHALAIDSQSGPATKWVVASSEQTSACPKIATRKCATRVGRQSPCLCPSTRRTQPDCTRTACACLQMSPTATSEGLPPGLATCTTDRCSGRTSRRRDS
mmetsp:Transcript_47576/g.101792  ORF Transcript_47576/g.101792 Transcript_47576/m.101792 type:complete len:234 (-) Transcript_47576:1553-2254(-)